MIKKLVKVGISLFCLAVALIPAWIYFGAKSMPSPEGFFQNFSILVLGGFLGISQTVLLIFWIGAVVMIWGE